MLVVNDEVDLLREVILAEEAPLSTLHDALFDVLCLALWFFAWTARGHINTSIHQRPLGRRRVNLRDSSLLDDLVPWHFAITIALLDELFALLVQGGNGTWGETALAAASLHLRTTVRLSLQGFAQGCQGEGFHAELPAGLLVELPNLDRRFLLAKPSTQLGNLFGIKMARHENLCFMLTDRTARWSSFK
jgi:hypothetical protein